MILTIQWTLLILVVAGHVYLFGRSIFHPSVFYIAFHALVFVFRPTLAIIFEFKRMYMYMRFYPNIDDIIRTIIIADLGLITFVLVAGLLTRNAIGVRPFPDRAAGESAPMTPEVYKAALFTCLLLAPLAAASMVYTVTHPFTVGAFNGDVVSNRLVRDAETGAALFTNSTAYFTSFQYVGATIAIMWAYIHRFKIIHCIPFAIYAVIRAYNGSARFSFLLLSIAFALALLAQRRKTQPTFTMIGAGMALLVVFSAIGGDRMLLKRLTFGVSQAEQAITYTGPQTQKKWSDNTALDGPDFANFEYLNFISHHIPETSGTFTYFTQYLVLMVKPIPRMLWKGKPANNVINLIDFKNLGNFVGLTTSLPGDGWMSAGYPGVVITVALVAALFGGIYRKFALATPTHFRVIAYCVLLGMSPQWFRDGGVSIAEFLLFHLLPVAVWWVIWRRLERARGLQLRQVQMRRQRRAL